MGAFEASGLDHLYRGRMQSERLEDTEQGRALIQRCRETRYNVPLCDLIVLMHVKRHNLTSVAGSDGSVGTTGQGKVVVEHLQEQGRPQARP